MVDHAEIRSMAEALSGRVEGEHFEKILFSISHDLGRQTGRDQYNAIRGEALGLLTKIDRLSAATGRLLALVQEYEASNKADHERYGVPLFNDKLNDKEFARQAIEEGKYV